MKRSRKILFEREILGFGVRGYESVIQELFPWANIEIDKDFYEANMDEECQRKVCFQKEIMQVCLAKRARNF